MITLRRADERNLDLRHRQELWHSFKPQDSTKPRADGFGPLEGLSENRLPPGRVSVARPNQEVEIVTYVWRGAIAQEDSTGSSDVIHAGEFQRMVMGNGIHHKETNASRTDWAHIFRISLRPSEVGSNGSREQMHVATGQRHNVLRIVASPDGRRGSLHTGQDAHVYSSVIDPGYHLIHELSPGRSAWLHVICGEATSHDTVLAQGDGVGVTNERSVSLTAHENCEILLVDLGEQVRRAPGLAG